MAPHCWDKNSLQNVTTNWSLKTSSLWILWFYRALWFCGVLRLWSDGSDIILIPGFCGFCFSLLRQTQFLYEVREACLKSKPFLALIQSLFYPPQAIMMIVLLLFLQKQSLAFAVYLFGIGTLHTGPGLKKKTHVIMLSPWPHRYTGDSPTPWANSVEY